MPPTAEQLANREKALANINQGLPQNTGITPSAIQGTVSPIQIPDLPQSSPQEYQGVIGGAVQGAQDIYNQIYGQQTGAEQTQGGITSEILKGLQEIQGRDQAQLTAEQEAGLPAKQKQLQELTGTLTQLQAESAAIPLQIQQEFAGRGATRGGVEPIQVGRLRENAIKSLTVGAQAQALQGNIALAQQQVNRAVDLQFKPIEDRLQYLQTAYTLNKDILDREDKQKSDQLQLQLQERSRLLEMQKSEKESVYDVMGLAGSYGAPASVLDEIANSSTYSEAVSAASGYLQNPAEVESIRLNNILKRVQIDRAQRELSLLGEPSEAETKATIAAMKEAEASIQVAQDKLGAVDLLKEHTGLHARVGTVPFLSRSKLSAAEFTGEGQDFAGGVHKLISGLTLDSLIAAKARGATFGALSDTELGILAAAASAIADWEVKDKNGVGKGVWNIDEGSFKRELNTIKDLTQRAIQNSQGTLFSSEESSQLDEIFTNDGTALNPAGYY